MCPIDGSIIFTSMRDGDLELCRMDADGKNVRQLTNDAGLRRRRVLLGRLHEDRVARVAAAPGKDLDDYKALLAQKLVKPTKMDLYVANADGTDARQITYLPGASFAPYFFPDGKRIIFSSNYLNPRSARVRPLFAVDIDGTHLERITFSRRVRRLPDVLARRQDARVLVEPQSAKRRRHQRVRRRWVDGQRAAVVETGADRVARDIAWLSDDAREGRGVGSAGLAAATAWLEKRFAEIGLEPVGGSHRHAFDVTVRIRSGPKTSFTIDGKPAPPEGFVPAAFSSSGATQGRVVVVGHGITAPELKVDDYRGVQAKDAIIVVRRFTPEAAPFRQDRC